MLRTFVHKFAFGASRALRSPPIARVLLQVFLGAGLAAVLCFALASAYFDPETVRTQAFFPVITVLGTGILYPLFLSFHGLQEACSAVAEDATYQQYRCFLRNLQKRSVAYSGGMAVSSLLVGVLWIFGDFPYAGPMSVLLAMGVIGVSVVDRLRAIAKLRAHERLARAVWNG